MKKLLPLTFPVAMTFRSWVDEIWRDIDRSSILETDHQNIYVKINTYIGTKDRKNPLRVLERIHKEIIYDHVFNMQPLQPYCAVYGVLHDALRTEGLLPLIAENHVQWSKAIQEACTLITSSDSHWFSDSHAHPIFSVAYAVKYFRGKKIPLYFDNAAPTLSTKEDEKSLVGILEAKICMIGGWQVIKYLETSIQKQFDPVIGRYRMGRVVDGMGYKIDRTVPYNYLYQLALKHIAVKGRRINSKKLYPELLKEATFLAAIFDVEPFSIYENMFGPQKNGVLHYLHNIIIYDQLFPFRQIAPKHARHAISNLFSWVDDELLFRVRGWRISDFINLSKLVLGDHRASLLSSKLTKQTLIESLSLKVNLCAAELLINDFMEKSTNTHYFLPSDGEYQDSFRKPLIRVGQNEVLIAAPLFAGYGLYEALFYQLAKTYAENERDIGDPAGKALEKFIFDSFQLRGITAFSDKFKDAGTEGDSDLIVETSDTVILFEIKKKSLTRKSLSGESFQILFDISEGILHGYIQLCKQEIHLLKHGAIKFESGRVLELKGRNIEKIVLTLHDYGGLHDRVTFQNVLDSLAGCNASGLVACDQKRLDKANKQFENLGARYTELSQLPNNPNNQRVSFNTWFLNAFHMLYILDQVKNEEDFKKVLYRIRSMTTGSQDFYTDLAFMQRAS